MNKYFTLLCVLFLFAGLPLAAQWQQKAAAFKKRSETTSLVYGGKLYTFLGFKDAALNPEPSSEVYDPQTDTWTLLASIPENKAMTHQGVVLIGDQVWHIGGRVGKHPGPLTSEIWIYNITTNTWTQGPEIIDPADGAPLKWGGGGAALLGRTLHLFGGFAQTACRGDQDRLHLTLDVDLWLANPAAPAPWKNEKAPMPIKRNHFGTVVLGGKIYALGGQFGHDCGGGHDKAHAHVYDAATDKWTELPKMPNARSHVEGSSFAMDGKIYVVAGQTLGHRNTNWVTVFDPSANGGAGAWSTEENLALPAAFEGGSAKAIGSTLFFTHGGQGNSKNTRNTNYGQAVSRNPRYELGFGVACGSFSQLAGSQATGSVLLFTIDGEASYSLASDAAWLSVQGSGNGEVGASGVPVVYTVNTAALAPGQYKGHITATGGGMAAFQPASFCVNLTVQASGAQMVVTEELILDGVRGKKGKERSVTISNPGTGDLVVTALSFGGTDADAFELAETPQLPMTVAAGANAQVKVRFAPPNAKVGALEGHLLLNGNTPEGAANTRLYGLSTKGEQGGNEPPLQAIVQTLGYKIDVGGSGLILSTGAEPIGDEVLFPVFRKAGAGTVAIKAVARYSPDDFLDFGYYTTSGGQPQLFRVGVIDKKQEQTLLPQLKSGGQHFDPGSQVFGLYTGATSYANRVGYTEDRLNTGPLAHAARIYPLKDRNGNAVVNSYLLAFEPAANGDYQDYVFVISNVKPAGRKTAGLLEAEEAMLDGAVVGTGGTGYSGTGYADFINNENDYVEWTLERDEAGPVVIAIKYANGQGGSRTNSLEVNESVVRGQLVFASTDSWNRWELYTDTIMLEAGTNTIRLAATGQAGPNIDYLSWQVLNGATAGVLEAEEASLSGVLADGRHKGFTGSGFADFQNKFDDFVEWVLPLSESGTVDLSFKYANGSKASRPLQLLVNGQPYNANLAFGPTGSWNDWAAESVSLNLPAGANTIRLTAIGASGGNIDHLAWSRPEARNRIAAKAAAPGLSQPFSVQLVPNPVRSSAQLRVQSQSALPLEVRVFDASGRLQLAKNFRDLTRSVAELPIAGLAPGIYMVQVKQGTALVTTRMVVSWR